MQGRWTIQGMRNCGHIVRGDALPDVGQRVPVVPCDDAAIERGAAGADALLATKPGASSIEIAEAVVRAAGEAP